MSLNTTPRTWASGELVTAALMNTEVRDALTGIQAAWTAYTPTWTATTTNPVIGNGTLTGAYNRVGKTVTVAILLTGGTTTTFGSGTWSLSLPVAAASGSISYIGSGVGFTTGASAGVYPQIGAGASTMTIYAPSTTAASPLAQLSNTGLAGSAWVASSASILRLNGTYQAA